MGTKASILRMSPRRQHLERNLHALGLIGVVLRSLMVGVWCLRAIDKAAYCANPKCQKAEQGYVLLALKPLNQHRLSYLGFTG